MITPIRYIFCYDIETGDKENPKTDPLTEIAVCVIDAIELKIVDEYSNLIKPYKETKLYTEDALNYSNITMDMLVNRGVSSKQVAEDIKFLIESYKDHGKIYLAGHNIVKFDSPRLEVFMKEHGVGLWKYASQDFCYDTIYWARSKWTESANYELGASCMNAGIVLRDAHRALNDTRANSQMLIEMLRSLRGVSTDQCNSERFRENFNISFEI